VTQPPGPEREPLRFPEVSSSFQAGLAHLAATNVVPEIDISAPGGTAGLSGAEWLAKAVGDGPRHRYVMRAEIGRGGMGAVYEVFDTDLRRTLAMKVALAGKGKRAEPGSGSSDQALLARFLEEAQVTGQLDHPGIVPLHEVGMDQTGQIYFTMRLVKGQDLHKVFELVWSGSTEWTLERAIVALVRVCEATGYAHSKGVVHRDLKPANIMTGRFGEVYVMDWGLAKVMGRPEKPRAHDPTTGSIVLTERGETEGGSSLETQAGTVIGTPVYMSPEQTRGEVEKVTPRSDIYSVGAMMYHLLAGRPPYLAPGARVSSHLVLSWVIQGPPRDLREIAPRVTPELAAICAKAMARDPADRYADMRELAEDLRMFLVGRPVSALSISVPRRAMRWCRRYPLATAAMVALVLGAGLGLWRLGELSRSLVEQSAIEGAALEAALLQEVNAFYTEAVTSRVDRAHVPVLSSWQGVAGAIPIPATFLTELGDRVSARAGDVRLRHYSEYPFKNRVREDLDDFQLQALKALRADPLNPLTTFDEVRGAPVLRYAVARRMEKGCVDCHNSHPESIKKDWQVGDVRGVLEIVRPLATDEARIQKGLRGTLILVAAVVGGLFLAALVGVLAFTRREAAKH